MKRENYDKLYRLENDAKTLEKALKIEKIDSKINRIGDEVIFIIGIDKVKPLIEEKLKEILKEIESL